MWITEVKPEVNETPTIKRVKVHKRGNLSLPKLFLETLGVSFEGGEVIAEIYPSKGKVILKRISHLKQIPEVDLKGFNREEAYLLRGAIPEAEEFFQDLEKVIRNTYPDVKTEIKTSPHEVVLKIGKLHLVYKESPSTPEGVITLKADKEEILFTNPRFSRKEAFKLGLTLAKYLTHQEVLTG
jgi:bifunctional DNA-binding transcriptional regulator/antitoxin component of YhaV-PrlF toxin-antitoxin module